MQILMGKTNRNLIAHTLTRFITNGKNAGYSALGIDRVPTRFHGQPKGGLPLTPSRLEQSWIFRLRGGQATPHTELAAGRAQAPT